MKWKHENRPKQFLEMLTFNFSNFSFSVSQNNLYIYNLQYMWLNQAQFNIFFNSTYVHRRNTNGICCEFETCDVIFGKIVH